MPLLFQFNLLQEETGLIICGFARTEEDQRIRLYSPYYGMPGANQKNGLALCADHEFMDVANFAEKRRQVQVGEHTRSRRMSLGQFTTTYLGGALHEFGHGLGLPHDEQIGAERKLGTSLMGSGNYTYRQELRGRRTGTFLSFSEAVRLISHPLFSGRNYQSGEFPKVTVKDLVFDEKEGCLFIRGRVESEIPVYAAIAYNDPEGNSDYNAETWTSVVEGMSSTLTIKSAFVIWRLII